LCAAKAIPILFGIAGIVAESFISGQRAAQNEGIPERETETFLKRGDTQIDALRD